MDRWKSRAKNEFDSWSRNYDRSLLQRIFFRPSHDLLLRHLRLEPDSRLLDIGCGTGLFACRLLRENPTLSVVGLDLSDRMLAKARKNGSAYGDRLTLVEGDSEALPFEDGSFDVVTCIHSFHHYPRQDRVAAEMARVLKQNGQLLLIDGDRDGWWGWLIFDGVVTTLEGLVHHCSAERFQGLFTEAGLRVETQVHAGWLAPFLLTHAVATKPAVSERRAA